MTQSGAWPPSRPDNDFGPNGLPEDAGLPVRVTRHIQPESGNDSGYSPFSIENCRVISAAETGTDLVEGQPTVLSGQPTGDMTGASDIKLALNRAQLSLRDAGDRGNDAGHVSDAHYIGMNLRQRDNRLVFNKNRGVPDRLDRLRISGRQDRWRERIAIRRAARKQARLHLKRMPPHLSDRSVLADRERSAGRHSSLPADQIEHGSAVLDVSGELIRTELDAPIIPAVEPQVQLGEGVVPDGRDGEGLVDLAFRDLDSGE